MMFGRFLNYLKRGSKQTNTPLNFEDKLQRLAECGLRLREHITMEELEASWGRDALESSGFDMALICLGMQSEIRDGDFHSDNVWHFDTECIEDHGCYVDIANRMVEMSQGSLPLTDIKDYVDLEQDKAWLEFTCQGEHIHIDCKVDDDWVDTDLFEYFVTVLAKCDPNRLYLYYDLGGQDCILACTTREEYRILKKEIPDFKPLS
jgi:hypothetical protein